MSASSVTIPGSSNSTLTLASGAGDVLTIAQQVGAALQAINDSSDLLITSDSFAGAPPQPPYSSVDAFPTGTTGDIQRLYQALLGRDADAGGLQFWTAQLNSGASLVTIADALIASPEYAQRFGSPSDTDFITQIYQQLCDRSPDAGGAYWVETLAAGNSRWGRRRGSC